MLLQPIGFALDMLDGLIVAGLPFVDIEESNSGVALIFEGPVSAWVDATDKRSYY